MRAVARSVATRATRAGARSFVRPTAVARMGHGHHVRRPLTERVPANHLAAARLAWGAGPRPRPAQGRDSLTPLFSRGPLRRTPPCSTRRASSRSPSPFGRSASSASPPSACPGSAFSTSRPTTLNCAAVGPQCSVRAVPAPRQRQLGGVAPLRADRPPSRPPHCGCSGLTPTLVLCTCVWRRGNVVTSQCHGRPADARPPRLPTRPGWQPAVFVGVRAREARAHTARGRGAHHFSARPAPRGVPWQSLRRERRNSHGPGSGRGVKQTGAKEPATRCAGPTRPATARCRHPRGSGPGRGPTF